MSRWNTGAAARALAMLSLGWPMHASGHAEWSVETDGTVDHDSNLLRLDDAAGQRPSNGACRADTFGTVQAKVIGQVDSGDWSLNVSGGPRRTMFACDQYLNYNGYDAFADLHGTLVGPLTVKADVVALRQLSSFTDVRDVSGNIQNYVRATGELALAITPDVRVVFDPRFSASLNSNPLYAQADYHSYGASVGIGWFTPLGNSIVLKATRTITDGLRPRLLELGAGPVNSPIQLRDDAFGAELVCHASVLTRVDGNLFYVRRHDRSLLAQSYSRVTGRLKVEYTPYDLLTLSAEGGQRLSNDDYLFVDSVREAFFNVSATRKLNGSGELDAKVEYEARKFSYDITLGSLRDESFKLLRFELGYAFRVLDTVSVRLKVAREYGYGTGSYPNYNDTSLGLSLSYKFGG